MTLDALDISHLYILTFAHYVCVYGCARAPVYARVIEAVIQIKTALRVVDFIKGHSSSNHA